MNSQRRRELVFGAFARDLKFAHGNETGSAAKVTAIGRGAARGIRN